MRFSLETIKKELPEIEVGDLIILYNDRKYLIIEDLIGGIEDRSPVPYMIMNIETSQIEDAWARLDYIRDELDIKEIIKKEQLILKGNTANWNYSFNRKWWLRNVQDKIHWICPK